MMPARPSQKGGEPGPIVIDNIVKEYETTIGLRRILDGISFAVHPGKKIAVLGRNGAGKSTLVKIIGGVELADLRGEFFEECLCPGRLLLAVVSNQS